ncbi:hypothetical protein [Streptomyces sp. NPDC048252]
MLRSFTEPPVQVIECPRPGGLLLSVLIRLEVDHLPGDRDPKPVWL